MPSSETCSIMKVAVTILVSLLLLAGCCAPATVSNFSTDHDVFTFFDDFDNWIRKGNEQYGEFSTNKSLTADAVVGKGEEFEAIQDALDAGRTCLYLKPERFNVTKPIVPPKEDFYVLGNGAEIVATQTMPAIFNISQTRYAHLDGLSINGNGLSQKCIDALRTPSQVPVHQIRNCRVWGATYANVDLTGCEDSMLFNCWIDGRKINDTPDAITEYGVRIGCSGDGYKTGGQLNIIHCLFSFHKKADVFAKNVAELKLSNCLFASKSMWSHEFTAHVIAEGGTGENPVMPAIELANCWMENGPGGDAPNILVANNPISKLTITGGVFFTDNSPNIYSSLSPCAETITLVGGFYENNRQFGGFNIVAPAQKLVSLGNTYNWRGIDKTGVASYLIFDRDDTALETR